MNDELTREERFYCAESGYAIFLTSFPKVKLKKSDKGELKAHAYAVALSTKSRPGYKHAQQVNYVTTTVKWRLLKYVSDGYKYKAHVERLEAVKCDPESPDLELLTSTRTDYDETDFRLDYIGVFREALKESPPREREIVEHMAKGLGLTEIGNLLGVSRQTAGACYSKFRSRCLRLLYTNVSQDVLDRALEQVTRDADDAHKKYLALYFNNSLGCEKIAERFGVSVSTVRHYLYRVKLRMYEHVHNERLFA